MATNTKKDTTAEYDPFQALTMTFEQFKVPGVDTNSFVQARRKDIDALVAANKIAYDAMQAMARTQTGMLTQVMHDMQEFTRRAMAGDPMGSSMTRHAETANKAWQKILADMSQMAAVMQKAQVETMTGLTERMTENIAEMKGLAQHK